MCYKEKEVQDGQYNHDEEDLLKAVGTTHEKMIGLLDKVVEKAEETEKGSVILEFVQNLPDTTEAERLLLSHKLGEIFESVSAGVPDVTVIDIGPSS